MIEKKGRKSVQLEIGAEIDQMIDELARIYEMSRSEVVEVAISETWKRAKPRKRAAGK